MTYPLRNSWQIAALLMASLLIFFAGGLIVTHATQPPLLPQTVLTEEPRWADPTTIARVQDLTTNVFTPDAAASPFQKYQNLGAEDQVLLAQAHRLTQGQLTSNSTRVTKAVGSIANADCLQISISYTFTGTTGLKVLSFPAYHEVCYSAGQILSQFTSAGVNPNEAPISFWKYNYADAVQSAGGIGQATVEVTTQAFYRLCVTGPNVGCVNKANPAYKVIVNATNGTYQIQGIQIPNPNAPAA